MRTHHRFRELAAVLAFSALVLPACAGAGDGGEEISVSARAARQGDLQVVLSLGDAAYAAHEAVVATVTITNVGHGTAKLLGWYLPAADLEEPLFRVSVDGQDAAFVGPHYKRPPADAADFVLLKPGASLTRTVDLGAFYDLSRTGDYAFRLEVDAARLRPEDAARGTLVASNTASAWVEGRQAAPQGDVQVDTTTGLLAYSRCSADQQPFVAQAVADASVLSNGALAYLAQTGPSGTPRYATWFGAFDAGRWNTVQSHYVAIADAFDNKDIVVDCGCKKKYYAYVYPNKPYQIYVCKVFWTAPPTGTDSKAGTLVHEMSHFTVTAGTDDWVYGQSGCKSLAISNPDRAIDNADSHEYFAENTPPLQ